MKKQRKPKAAWITFGNDGAYWVHWSLKQANQFGFAMHFSKHDLSVPVKYVREVKRRKK
jgi:hypothetical protein